MPTLKILARGQVTLPKKFREVLGLETGDLIESEMKDGYIVLKPKKRTKAEAFHQFESLLDRVHAKNKDASEEEVERDVMQAVEEVRQEEYARRKQAKRHP